ncbi:hypothetical protein [Rhizobium ruizarguesonis]|uniref:hypothetical protein n=1 Tax=Rhizobium ruizarguesonis TaxID=2081791 RepID=UPI00103099E0|nr:hypothetical protein [Rhizobium ruizarguesonis]TBD71609.1 hypothetical protein ELH11_38585 [Rhizobium ruizarguesonis]TBD94851.1 hypothetical protein ELH09_38305 [Rhizobium ruizarguesonis]TBE14531.1 hypothetical protein ELH07_38325 [Rhizobium ruizarguesonis]TBE14700.1 hypothetical protein ELH08_38870 [Rhizobium ruizarguesonis]WSH04967.1 hypothetical protein U8P71_34645 [Rhizobium ruizarguesonis]
MIGLTLSCAESAHAAWFVRKDAGDRLVVTAVATDDSGTPNGIYLSCTGPSLEMTIPTSLPVDSFGFDPQPRIAKMHPTVIFSAEVENRSLQRFATPGDALGDALDSHVSVRTRLAGPEAVLLTKWIADGRKIDVETADVDFQPAQGRLSIEPTGFSQASSAIEKFCKS